MSPTSHGYFHMHSLTSFCASYSLTFSDLYNVRYPSSQYLKLLQSLTVQLTFTFYRYRLLNEPNLVLTVLFLVTISYSWTHQLICYGFCLHKDIILSASSHHYFRLFNWHWAQCSLLLQFVMTQGPSILVQCPAVYIVFSHYIHRKVLEMFSFSLHTSVTSKKIC